MHFKNEKPNHVWNRALPFLISAAVVSAIVATPLAAQQIDVRLRSPSVTCFQKTIRVRDVAELSGGNPLIRQQLAALDLDEFAVAGTAIEITKQLVRFRAVMAGIDETEFRITGGSSIDVHFSATIDSVQVIEQSLRNRIADTFQIPDTSLEVQLLTAIDAWLMRSGLDLSTLSVVPQLPAELPLGQRTIELAFTDAAGRSESTNASIKVAVYRDLVMVKQNISRGELLAEDKLERIRRPIDNPQVSFASYDQAIGKFAQNDIQQFALVKAQNVRDVDRTVASFDVKRNSTVNIVVQRGTMAVTLKDARANENGRIGDYIDFINPKSKEIIRARIVDSTTATIEL